MRCKSGVVSPWPSVFPLQVIPLHTYKTITLMQQTIQDKSIIHSATHSIFYHAFSHRHNSRDSCERRWSYVTTRRSYWTAVSSWRQPGGPGWVELLFLRVVSWIFCREQLCLKGAGGKTRCPCRREQEEGKKGNRFWRFAFVFEWQPKLWTLSFLLWQLSGKELNCHPDWG